MSFSTQLEVLQKEVTSYINSKVALSTDKGLLRSGKSIVITNDNLMFNLEGGRYLSEITNERLIDNDGHEYDFSFLDFDKLCELADSLIIHDAKIESEDEFNFLHRIIRDYVKSGGLTELQINILVEDVLPKFDNNWFDYWHRAKYGDSTLSNEDCFRVYIKNYSSDLEKVLW